MARVYVSVGSNINQDQNIRGGIRALRDHYGEVLLSRVYESTAVGFDGDNFYNLVLAFDTEEAVQAVAQRLRDIEEQFGRVRGGPRFSSRTLDLDLLLYDQQIMKAIGFDIPRDEITRNAFVLLPLSELAPARRHPQLDKSYQQLWSEFDQTSQSLWPIEFNWD